MRGRTPPRARGLLAWAIAAALTAAYLLASLPVAADSEGDDERLAAPAELPVEPQGVTPEEGHAASPNAAGPSKTPRKPGPPAKKRRGGVNPCMTPDTGFGVYDGWSRAPSMGQMIAPHKGGIHKSGSFDLLVHFHGHEAVRKEFVKNARGIVLVGIDLGIGSGAYSSAFAAPHVFQNLLRSVEAGMAKHTGNPKAKVRKLGLSSWSAGYGAIEQILRQPAGKKVDSLVMLDSLHAGYVDEQAKTLKAAQLEPFVDFAQRAAAKSTFMFMSHSSIIPPGYASTQETAEHIVARLKGKPRSAKRQDVLGLDLFQRFDRGDLHIRGYTGDDKPDHCAHIGLIADVVKVHLNKRWNGPRGRR